MKVRRYTTGSTNVAELQAQRNVALSPAEAAQAAAVPYEAVSQIADTTADTLNRYQLEANEEQDKQDAMASALNVSNYKNAIANSEAQAKAEGWSREQYEADVDAVNQAFAGSVNLISERNRSEIDNVYRNTIAAEGLATQRISYGIGRTLLTEDYANQRAQATQNQEWETVAFLDDMANQSGLITEAEKLKLTAANEGQIQAEGLMNEYRDAADKGNGDEYLLKVSKMDLSPEAQQIFNAQKSQYDQLTKDIANQVRQEQGLKLSNYYHYGITRNTTPDDITAFIRDNKIYDEGKMSKLYGRLESIKNDESVILSNDYNPGAAADRKAFNALLPTGPDVTEREMFEASIGISIARNIAPQWLDGHFNRGAYNTDNPQEFAQVAEDYYSFAIITDRLPVTITEEARARFEMYTDLRMAKTDINVAAGLVLSSQKALTEDAYEANVAAFDDPTYGTVEDVAPEITINKLVEQKIESDTATILGLNITEKGVIWDTDKIPPIPPAMRREMNRVSRNMWAYTTNEEVAANAVFGTLRSSGWSATDANEGVTGPDGTKMGYQYMRNPPEKPFAVTRAEMSDDKDISGRKFQIPGEYQEGTARYNWREIDPMEVQLGEGQAYTNDKKQQKMHWPMLINGEQLLYRQDGETKLAFFEYGELPRINEEEFQIIEEAHKRANEERRKRSITIDPGLKF